MQTFRARERAVDGDFGVQTLEARQLLATFATADFFPMNIGDQWNYSGTINAEPMTATTTVARGPATGVPTMRVRTVFDLDQSTDQFVDARFFANNATGFRLVKRNVTEPTLTDFQTIQGSGARYLPPTFDEGATYEFTRNFSGVLSDRGAYTGNFSGSVVVDEIDNITTSAGTFEAIRVRVLGTINQNGASGWTATGTVSESRWLARGVGTVRIDYADIIEYSDSTGHAFRFNMGLTSTNRLNDTAGLEVRGNGIVISYGDSTPTLLDGTNFGPVDVNAGSRVQVFRVRNNSTQAITLGGPNGRVSITGLDAEDFMVARQPPRVIQPGGEVGFRVRFNPSARGLQFATVTLATVNNSDRPYTFNIRGNGVFTGTIAVAGLNNVAIANGAAAGRPNDGTRFGVVDAAGDSSVSRTFIIRNTGAGGLTLGDSRVTVSGDGAADFSITTFPSFTIGRNQTSSFIVTFNPTLIGSRKATVSIFSNDASTPVFTFTVAGTGV